MRGVRDFDRDFLVVLPGEAWRVKCARLRADLIDAVGANRYAWYPAHDWKAPYPSHSTIQAAVKVAGG